MNHADTAISLRLADCRLGRGRAGVIEVYATSNSAVEQVDYSIRIEPTNTKNRVHTELNHFYLARLLAFSERGI